MSSKETNFIKYIEITFKSNEYDFYYENLLMKAIIIKIIPIPMVAILPFHISACGVKPLFHKFSSFLSTKFFVSLISTLDCLFIEVRKEGFLHTGYLLVQLIVFLRHLI